MRIPEKGKAVQYSLMNGATKICYSRGEECSINKGALLVSEYSDGKGDIGYVSNWQEVEITPVVHVPEGGKVCAVWDEDIKPEIPKYRVSLGKLDDGKCLVTYGDGITATGRNGVYSYWKHWEEL